MTMSYPSFCTKLIPDKSSVNAAVIPVEPDTELIASFNSVKLLVLEIVALTVDAFVLFP